MFILLFFTFYLYAQEESSLFLKPKVKTKQEVLNQLERIKKNLEYELNKSPISAPKFRANNSDELIKKCFEGVNKVNTSSFINAVEDCYNKYNHLRSQQLNSNIENVGISRAQHYNNIAESIKNKVETEIKSLTKDDTIVITDSPFIFAAQDSNNSQLEMPGLDETAKELSQFRSIFIHLNKSKNIEELTKNSESEDLKYDLTQLIYALGIKNGTADCIGDNAIQELESFEMANILTNNPMLNKDLRYTNLLGMYFPDSKLKHIEAFQISQDGRDYLLFRDKHELTESWLLSYKDEYGNDLYRKFKIIETEKENIRDTRNNTRNKFISLINVKDYHKKFIKTDQREVDVDLNLGIDVKFRKERIPGLGQKFIPTDDISIGSIGVMTKGSTFGSNSNINLDSDEIRMQSSLITLKDKPISLDAGIRYRMFDSKWSQYSAVRGYNMVIQYSTDSNSNQSFGAEYYHKNNYVGYNTNLKNKKEFIVGRKFKNNKGGIHTSTDISGQFRQNITLLLILD